MAFRDDRDALLARADALQLENSRLRESREDTEVELAAATAELDRVRAALETLETQRSRARELESNAAPRLASDSTTDAAQAQRLRAHRRRAIIVFGCVFLMTLWVTTLWVTTSSDGDSDLKPRAVPVKHGTAVAKHGKTEETPAQQAVAKVRRCLDGGDVYLRNFLVNPKRRQRNLTIQVDQCIAPLTNLAEPSLAAQADEYQRATATLRPHLTRLISYYEAKQYEDGPELGLELAERRADAVARWRQASNRLRKDARAAIDAERARALKRAEATGEPEIIAFVRFGGAASTFLNELATSAQATPALQRAYDLLRQIRVEYGPSGGGGKMADLIDRASAVLRAMHSARVEIRDARVASASTSFVRKYNMARYGVPYPFSD